MGLNVSQLHYALFIFVSGVFDTSLPTTYIINFTMKLKCHFLTGGLHNLPGEFFSPHSYNICTLSITTLVLN